MVEGLLYRKTCINILGTEKQYNKNDIILSSSKPFTVS